VDPDVRVIPNELPVQPVVRVQSKAAAAAIVTSIRRGRRVTESQRLVNAGRASSGEAAASNANKTAIPV
jgi:hypothetical protein